MSITLDDIGEPVAQEYGDLGIELLYINPRPRRIPEEILEQAVEAIELGANQEEIEEKLMEDYGNGDLGDEIEFDEDCEVMFMPSMKPERIYIAGQQGLGKSWICKEYAKRWKCLYPEGEIVLISRHDDDETYDDGEEMNHLLADQRLFEQDWSLENLAGKLIIFDDMDNLVGGLAKFVKDIIQDIASNGRKYGIYLIYVSHLICDGSKTRSILNEANKVVIFPGNSVAHNKRYLNTYAGFGKMSIEKVLSLKGLSRWACICTGHSPAYVVHQKGMFLIKE
jgi:hypothetical protein